MNSAGSGASDSPLDPAAMLELVNHQQRAVGRALARHIPWILFAWAIAWGLGFALLWLAAVSESIPGLVATLAFAALLAGAVVVSAVVGSRANRGIRPTSSGAFTGTLFGVTATAAGGGLTLLGYGLMHNGMPSALMWVYFPSISALLIGILYLMAAAIWRERSMVILGGWLILVGAVAPFFGTPNHFLVFAIAGGGGFLVSGVLLAIHTRTGRLALGD